MFSELLSKGELGVLKAALEKDDGIMSNYYRRSDGEGGRTKVALWNQPGQDITGVIARSEKVAGIFEEVKQFNILIIRICIID